MCRRFCMTKRTVYDYWGCIELLSHETGACKAMSRKRRWNLSQNCCALQLSTQCPYTSAARFDVARKQKCGTSATRFPCKNLGCLVYTVLKGTLRMSSIRELDKVDLSQLDQTLHEVLACFNHPWASIWSANLSSPLICSHRRRADARLNLSPSTT